MAWGKNKPKESEGVVIFCNYCSFLHEIFTGKSTCPQCKKPAGLRPQEWYSDKKTWSIEGNK